MIIDITSFGWSGSGAYEDFLRGYDEIEFLSEKDWESRFLWDVDGIYDLEQKLCGKTCRVFDSDMAVQRFFEYAHMAGKYAYYDANLGKSFEMMCRDYINELNPIRFDAISLNDRLHPSDRQKKVFRLKHTLSKLHLLGLAYRLGFDKYLNKGHEMFLIYKPKDFLPVTQKFVSSILNSNRKNQNGYLVTNQLLPPDCPHLFTKYIKEELKCIIVSRDPRDMYINAKVISPRVLRRRFPVPAEVNGFIRFYRETIMNAKQKDSDMFLSVCLEDLIYEYQRTSQTILSFIGYHGESVAKKICFNPLKSVNNTQIWRLYPEFSDDIKKIEDELPEALFPFGDYSLKPTSTPFRTVNRNNA